MRIQILSMHRRHLAEDSVALLGEEDELVLGHALELGVVDAHEGDEVLPAIPVDANKIAPSTELAAQ